MESVVPIAEIEVSAELYFTEPVDNWCLALHRRYCPNGINKNYPILMVHGFGNNRYIVDLMPTFSIAQTMAALGFDVFILELRGVGCSKMAMEQNRNSNTVSFIDYATRDVPTAIEKVLELTKAEQIHYFGHSMGGMLGYAYTLRSSDIIRSLTTVASPILKHLSFKMRELMLFYIGNAMRMPSMVVKSIPLPKLMSLINSRVIRISARAIDGILLNTSNVEPDALVKISKNGICNLETSLLWEFNRRILDPEDSQHPFEHEDSLEQLTKPLLAIAGSGDPLGAPEAVKAATAVVNSDVAHYVEFGKRWGHLHEYGHGDLLIGKNAPDEVYPIIAEFICDHDRI